MNSSRKELEDDRDRLKLVIQEISKDLMSTYEAAFKKVTEEHMNFDQVRNQVKKNWVRSALNKLSEISNEDVQP